MRRPVPRPRFTWRRGRRVLTATAVLCLLPVLVSYLAAVLGPSNSSFFITSVEWMRDHGARGWSTTSRTPITR